MPLVPLGKKLIAFVTEDFPGLPFSQKVFFLHELANWVRQNHAANCFFYGRGVESVYLQWDGGETLEFQRCSSDTPIWPLRRTRRQIQDLAAFYAQSYTALSRADRFRFLHAYFGPQARLKDLRSLLRAVEEAGLCQIFRKLKQRQKFCWGTNRDFQVETAGRFVVRRRATEKAAAFAAALLPDPEGLLAGAERLPGRGNNCLTYKIHFGASAFVIKRYAARGWMYKLKHAFRHSRGVRVWGGSWELLSRGAPVPEPLLCLEEQNICFPGVSYLVFEFFSDSQTLTCFWPHADKNQKLNLLANLAKKLGRIHRLKAIHGDTNWDNVLVLDGGRLALIDLDCSRFFRCYRPKRAEKDIQHVFRDLRRLEKNSVAYEQFFYRVWQKWAHALHRGGQKGPAKLQQEA
ncbi:hypothetical protein EG832_00720 [bacterium]|nr:hypothetical protein [bacterium]